LGLLNRDVFDKEQNGIIFMYFPYPK